MFPTDSDVCARIARNNARTFALASRLLPAEKRRGAYALYGFCRTADDIVDRPRSASFEEPAAALVLWTEAVRRALEGQPDGPVLRELAWTVSRFPVPQAAVFELLAGVAQDLTPRTPQTWRDLELYCAGVASSVGEMCMAVFGVRDDRQKDEARRCARILGQAMQLTNILRDVGEDAALGRCYLPIEELARYQLTPDDVLHHRERRTSERAAWRDFMSVQIARTRALYRTAAAGIALLQTDAQPCAIACATGYAGILGAIEHMGYDTFSHRARLSWPERGRVLYAAWRRHVPWRDTEVVPPAPVPRFVEPVVKS